MANPKNWQNKGPKQAPKAVPGKEYVVGRKPVAEFIAREPSRVDVVMVRKGLQGRDVEDLLAACKSLNLRYKFVDTTTLDRVHANNQGMAVQVSEVGYVDLDQLIAATREAPLPVLLALDQVQDTGNVGALARTLYGLGGGGMVVVQHGGAYLGAGAVKASAGAIHRIPVAKAMNLGRALDQCQEAGFTIYGTAKGGPDKGDGIVDAISCTDPLPMPAVLVLGNEDKGIRPSILKACEYKLEIPMHGDLDSYNVSSAGSICLAALARSHWSAR